MGLELTTVGDPLLRRRARALTAEEVRSDEIQALVTQMREAMLANKGVGLAAPQIGHGIRLIVIEDSPEMMAHLPPERREAIGRRPIPFQVLANPVITPLGDERVLAYESCLSVVDAGLHGSVERACSVRVEALDGAGHPIEFEATGWHARILQHEVDHLEGVLILDRMDMRTACNRHHFDRRWKHLNAEQVIREFAK